MDWTRYLTKLSNSGMTITGEKMRFTQFSTRMAASELFHMFTQSIKFCTLYYHVSKSADVSKMWFIKDAPFSKFYDKIWAGFILTLENIRSYRFHFKAKRKSIDSSKNGTKDFPNSPPFERSACFYLTLEILKISILQHCNRFSGKQKPFTERSQCYNKQHGEMLFEKRMLQQTAWWVQNGPIILQVTTSFFWKFYFQLKNLL